MTYHAANQRSLDFVQTSSQSVSVNSSPTLALTGSFTIAAWIFPKAGSTTSGASSRNGTQAPARADTT
jgi:hypothetical protein